MRTRPLRLPPTNTSLGVETNFTRSSIATSPTSVTITTRNTPLHIGGIDQGESSRSARDSRLAATIRKGSRQFDVPIRNVDTTTSGPSPARDSTCVHRAVRNAPCCSQRYRCSSQTVAPQWCYPSTGNEEELQKAGHEVANDPARFNIYVSTPDTSNLGSQMRD